MSKKSKNWIQDHIQTLKQRNAILTECCADWAAQDLAQMQHIQRLGGEVTALRRQVNELQKELMKRDDKAVLILNGMETPCSRSCLEYEEIAKMTNRKGLCTITYQNALGEGSVVAGESAAIVGKTIINCFNT